MAHGSAGSPEKNPGDRSHRDSIPGPLDSALTTVLPQAPELCLGSINVKRRQERPNQSMQPSRASEGLQPSMNAVSFPYINNVAVRSHETVNSLKWIRQDGQV